jgi:vacuolar-type H+-ATPase subunit F/Vma7
MTEEQEEVNDLVDGITENPRTKIINTHDDLLQRITDALENVREVNAIFSEARRRIEE